MSSGFHPRLAFAIACVLLSGTLVRASLTHTTPSESGSLAGQILIASPSMSDPRFARTVIYMVKHDRNGALGIAINRPVGERSLSEILAAIGDKETTAEGNIPVFAGGPVEQHLGFVLHSADYRRAETHEIDGRVAMTSSRDVMRDIALGKGPAKKIVAFGYSGWGPGQLEGELKMQAWFVAPADLQLVFDIERDKVWAAAMARRPRDI